ncbi:glycosyltransferase [Catellatospora sp. IY07-71]|uniref:bifunctional glycosyltransferase/CDP-glycerol:glycerophosphate glycerophosphotransferase n=1 Tax=Catellatospora sp. IY07-71 TaxID=2728827 RepID=UPI001BB3F1B3|nr:glycosyltransferase [Catellatospora sp. IY07-71]
MSSTVSDPTVPAYDVAVVVPIYNVAAYLGECLDSIAGQTVFARCQVLLVDDGSTDLSPEIAQRFAGSHENVVYLRQENAGPGAARNRALDLADAAYVGFCDADDVLPPQAIELLLTAIRTHGATIAVGNMDTFPARTDFVWKKHFGKGDRVFSGLADAPDLIFDAGPCHKLYDLAALRASGLRFREGVHFEDAFLCVPMWLRAERIALVDRLVYRYRRRPTGDSIMDGLFVRPANYWDHLLLNETLDALRPGLDLFRKEALERFLVRSYQGFAMRAHELFGEADLRRMFDACCRIYRDIDISFIVKWTLDTRHRVAYLACKAGDFEMFAHPDRALRGVLASGGDLFLDYPAPSGWLPLLKSSGMKAYAEQVRLSADGAELEISGQFTINGLPLTDPDRVSLALRLVGSAVTVPAQAVYRSDIAAARPDNAWGGFTARVPAAKLRPGVHTVRLVVDTPTGQASRTCAVSAAYLRDAYPRRVKGRVVIPRTPRTGEQALLVVHPLRSRRERFKARMWSLRQDYEQYRRRDPFWRHRLVRLLTLPLMRRRDVWLLGERHDTAQDNSYHLFRHLRGQRRRHVYYLLRKGSPDRARLRGLGNVVRHGSLRHKFLMLHAKRLINSYDIDSYMLPPDWDRPAYLRHLSWRVGARRVFLDHGVVDKDLSTGMHRGRFPVELFVTSAARETEYVAERFDLRERAQTLGLPRFDGLVPERGSRRVLFMPTWRSYLVVPSYSRAAAAKQEFRGSTYHRFLTDFLESPRLAEALRRHGYRLDFLPHYEMRHAVLGAVAQSDVVRMIDQGTESVQDALRRCDLFVTDWSSTAYDVAYLGTPLVYAEFDPEEYRAGHYRPGYFDTARDGFGPVCGSAEEAVTAVIGYLARDCVREDEYTLRAKHFFEHQDRENSARVARAIEAIR